MAFFWKSNELISIFILMLSIATQFGDCKPQIPMQPLGGYYPFILGGGSMGHRPGASYPSSLGQPSVFPHHPLFQQAMIYPSFRPTRLQGGSPYQQQLIQIPYHPSYPFFWHPAIGLPMQGILPPSESTTTDVGGTRITERANTCSYFHETGVCMKQQDCQNEGGIPRNYCRDFTKFCCIMHYTCGDSTSSTSSYFRNSKYPISTALGSSCSFIVRRSTDENICGVRISIHKLKLPASTGYCDGIDLSIADVGGQSFKSLCGDQSGKQYDIDFKSGASMAITINTRRTFRLIWNIHITQLGCSEHLKTTFPLKGSSSSTGSSGTSSGTSTSGTSSGGTTTGGTSTGGTTSGGTSSGGTSTGGTTTVTSSSSTLSCGQSPIRRIHRPFLSMRDSTSDVLDRELACVDEKGINEKCRNNGLANPLLQSVEWAVPLVNESQLYKYSGLPATEQTERITSGSKTLPHEYPWAVAMYSNGRFHCGASLISNRHVLTAAHCVIKKRNKPHTFKLSIGDWNINSQADGANIEARVAKIVTHPGYSSVTLKYDVAVLTLTSPVSITKNALPICLPRYDINLSGKLITVSGWGRDERNKLQSILKKHQAGPILNNECDRRWQEKGAPAGIIAPIMMCMDPQTGDSCKGDSGGPAIIEEPDGSGKFVQVGIVSFGSASCVDKRLPGVYTRVGKVADWIKQQMN